MSLKFGQNRLLRFFFQCNRCLSEKTISQKRLDIAIVGHPNAGKSTLVNYMCGSQVMPVSSKVHTTRHLMRGFLTKGDTQLLFWDSPGIVPKRAQKKHNLPQSIMDDPIKCIIHCDLIALIVDCTDFKHTSGVPPQVKDRLFYLFSREFGNQPVEQRVILVLNKVDIFKGNQAKLKEIVLTLTAGKIAGKSIESASAREHVGKGVLGSAFETSSSKQDEGHTESQSEAFFEDVSKQRDRDTSIFNISTIANKDLYYEILRSTKRLRGFDGFSAVFTISALDGYGIDNLLRYFFSNAKPGAFEVEEGVKTDAALEKVVENVIVSQLMEHLMSYLPYQVEVEVQDIYKTPPREDEEAHLVIVVLLYVKAEVAAVIGRGGDTLYAIASDSKQQLKEVLGCDVKLSLTVEERRKKTKTNSS